jgi:hypothetical protein
MLISMLSLACISLLWPNNEADAYWGYQRWRDGGYHSGQRFQPRFSMTLSGGFHFIDTYVDDYGDVSHPFTYGMMELGGHVWVHPNISIDLNVGAHLAMNNLIGAEWGYVSVKPGARVRFRWFYLRGALDIAFSDRQEYYKQKRRPILFGFLVGMGVRIPVGYRMRLFAELDYQFLFTDYYYMPFYGQLGLEYIF